MSGFRQLAGTGDTIVVETQRPGRGQSRNYLEGVVVNHDFVTLDGARGFLLRVLRDVRDGIVMRERVGQEICIPFDLGPGDWRGRIRLLQRATRWHQDAAEDGLARPV